MGLTQEDILADRTCRLILRDRHYSGERSRMLIHWLASSWHPTSDIAGVTLSRLGPQAFRDVLSATLAHGDRLNPRFVATLESFTAEHDRLLPLLREWLRSSTGDLKLQCAVSLARVVGERLRQGKAVEVDDVTLFRSVLDPAAATNPVVRIHLRDFNRAAEGAA